MVASRCIRDALVVVGVVGLTAGVGGAASIVIGSATVERTDDPARVCVGLTLEADELVAGTENLVVWNGACATLLFDTCAANPAHGKDLSGAPLREQDFTYKALVLSLTDTDPIPAGELYCCDFLAHVTTAGECCEVRVEAPGASDPLGNALVTTAGSPGQICLADGVPPATATPILTSTPSPTRVPGSPTVIASLTPLPTGTSGEPSITGTPGNGQTRTPTQAVRAGGDDDACAVVPPRSVAWLPWLAGAVLLALRRPRRSRSQAR